MTYLRLLKHEDLLLFSVLCDSYWPSLGFGHFSKQKIIGRIIHNEFNPQLQSYVLDVCKK